MKTQTLMRDVHTTLIKKSESQKLDSLISLINCANTNIAKQTFYNEEDAQKKTMLSIHQQALDTSRIFYALMLLPDFVTDANRKISIANLLSNVNVPLEQKEWEKALMMQSFSTMQPNRVFDALNYLIDMKINNSRTRHTMRDFLKENRHSLSLWALKYKNPFKRIIRHAHISSKLHEAIEFLNLKKTTETKFQDNLLSNYIKTKFGDTEAIYKLPLTIARGFAAKYKIKESDFIKQFSDKGQLTQKEKRQQQREFKEKGVHVAVDLAKLDLFDLFVYLGMAEENKSIPKEALTLIKVAAKRTADNIPYHFDNACVILDTSLSMSGTQETKNHPLYRSLAISAVINQLSDKFVEYRTNGESLNLIPQLTAQTNYSVALLQALKAKHHYIFILGDGYENTPYEGASNQILTVYKNKIDKEDKTVIIHFNPVFASEAKNVRSLFTIEKYQSVGIRDAKSLVPSMFLAISKQDKLSALKAYLTQLLQLQNTKSKALQPNNVQLLLE